MTTPKKTRARAHVEKLTVTLASGLPDEIRLFVFGENVTTKGTFLFDAEAAKMVMDAYEAHGVDLAIDLEHAMLDANASPDPTARDARGWCGLQLRDDGLYACRVKWTDDGAARLTGKRQRYVSPAFTVDPKTNRITKIVNIAITSTPSTYETPALVAASRLKDTTMPTLNDAIALLESGDVAAALEMLKALAAEAEKPPAKDAPPPKTDPEVQAASARLMKLTSTHSLSAAVAHVSALAAELQTVAAERDGFAEAERIRLCSSLVVDAGRAPASVWATPDARIPKPYLAAMTLSDLRDHLRDELATAGKRPATRAPLPAAGAERIIATRLGNVVVTASEIVECERAGAKLEVFALNKAARDQARGAR